MKKYKVSGFFRVWRPIKGVFPCLINRWPCFGEVQPPFSSLIFFLDDLIQTEGIIFKTVPNILCLWVFFQARWCSLAFSIPVNSNLPICCKRYSRRWDLIQKLWAFCDVGLLWDKLFHRGVTKEDTMVNFNFLFDFKKSKILTWTRQTKPKRLQPWSYQAFFKSTHANCSYCNVIKKNEYKVMVNLQ